MPRRLPRVVCDRTAVGGWCSECGVDFDKPQTSVIDHFKFDKSDSDGEHTLILAEDWVQSPVILGPSMADPVLYRGIGHAIDDENKLLIKVLTASSTAYSANPKTAIPDFPESAGKDTLLVSAMQARNGARLAFSGSMEMCSNT